jgi:hypothetical protein
MCANHSTPVRGREAQLCAFEYFLIPRTDTVAMASMILRRSRFVHQLPVGKDRTLIVHAISHMRLPADNDISALVDYFSEPRRMPEDCDAMTALVARPGDTPADLRDVVERTVMELLSRQILTEKTP